MSEPIIRNGMTVAGLRISDGEQHRILSELEHANTEITPAHERRASTRQALPPNLVVKALVKQPGGTVHKFRVRARNLNDHGISLLHGGFLHIGSSCTVEILDGSMPLVKIPATVIRCRYLRQTVHEVGLQFEKPIDAQGVITGQLADHQPPPPEEAKLPRLRGRVLHVDPIEADRRYLDYRMAQLGLNFRNAQTTLEAIEMANAQRFDLVLAEYRLRPDPAPFLVRRLRGGGFTMPIVVMGHNLTRSAAKDLIDIGATACLSKPFKNDDLIKVLCAHLPEADDQAAATDALLSQHWPEEAFRPLIIEYVNDLNETLNYLSRTIMESATEADALSSAQQLAATAGLYGFPPITEAAHELSTMLTLDPLPTDMIFEQMINLQSLAKAAQHALG